jgi:hypothetical protein
MNFIIRCLKVWIQQSVRQTMWSGWMCHSDSSERSVQSTKPRLRSTALIFIWRLNFRLVNWWWKVWGLQLSTRSLKELVRPFMGFTKSPEWTPTTTLVDMWPMLLLTCSHRHMLKPYFGTIYSRQRLYGSHRRNHASQSVCSTSWSHTDVVLATVENIHWHTVNLTQIHIQKDIRICCLGHYHKGACPRTTTWLIAVRR